MIHEPSWGRLADELESLKAVEPLRAQWHAYVGSEQYGIWILRPDGHEAEQARATFTLIAAQIVEKLGIPPIPVPLPAQHCPHWAEYCGAEEDLSRQAGQVRDLGDAVPYGLDRIDRDAVDPCTRAFLEVLRGEGRAFRITSNGTDGIRGKSYATVAGCIDDLCGAAAAYCKRHARDEIGARLSNRVENPSPNAEGLMVDPAERPLKRQDASTVTLTSHQKDLLSSIVAGHQAGDGAAFIFLRDVARCSLVYPRGRSITVTATEADFSDLAAEGLVSIVFDPRLSGAPTQLGIETVESWRNDTSGEQPASRESVHTAVPTNSWGDLGAEFLQYAVEHAGLRARWIWEYTKADQLAQSPPRGKWILDGGLPSSQHLFREIARKAVGWLPNTSSVEPWRHWLDLLRAEGYARKIVSKIVPWRQFKAAAQSSEDPPRPRGFENEQIESLFQSSADFCLIQSLADTPRFSNPRSSETNPESKSTSTEEIQVQTDRGFSSTDESANVRGGSQAYWKAFNRFVDERPDASIDHPSGASSEAIGFVPASGLPVPVGQNSGGVLPLSEPTDPSDDAESVRATVRSNWLDRKLVEKRWTADTEIAANGGPTYNTIQRYRSGKQSTRDRSVRLSISEAFDCGFSDVPE